MKPVALLFALAAAFAVGSVAAQDPKAALAKLKPKAFPNQPIEYAGVYPAGGGLDAIARQGVSPALTVLLDCPVEVGLRRARGDDRFHREEREFHELPG